MNDTQKAALPKGPYVFTKLTEHTGVIRAANNVTVLKLTSNMTQTFRDGSRFLAPNMEALALLVVESLNVFWATGKSPKDLVQAHRLSEAE